MRKLKKAKEKDEPDRAARLYNNKPTFPLQHVVKERYPSFVDAVRDLDDALTLCFLFARMPNSSVVRPQVIHDCRRLTVEFLHYVIAAKALRKVFVSIKGIYYQAEILGEKITWIVPHERKQPEVTEVDFSVMATFLEFYRTMLGCTNCRLYSLLGLHYPPKLKSRPLSSLRDDGDYADDPEASVERVYSLGDRLERVSEETEGENDPELDSFPVEGESDEVEKARTEQERVGRLRTLFKGTVVFLNREVPRESLVFVIRTCGGDVSWDASSFYGSTFQEDDPTITHQIVDRPNLDNKNINRKYVQPQWVYDCVNAGRLLAEEEYFLGMDLPPHLSPFVEEQPGDYVPPERIAEMEMEGKDVSGLKENIVEVDSVPAPKKAKKDKEEKDAKDDATMKVTTGNVYRTNKQKEKNERGQEEKLKEMMIAKKHKRVYHKIKKGIKKKNTQVKAMREKRKVIDKQRKG